MKKWRNEKMEKWGNEKNDELKRRNEEMMSEEYRLPPLHQPRSWGTRVNLGDTNEVRLHGLWLHELCLQWRVLHGLWHPALPVPDRINPIENPERLRTTCIFTCFCDLWAVFILNLWKRCAWKLRSVILLHFEYNFWIWLYENPQTLHFYDFGISGRVPKPPNPLFLSLETPGYLK